MPQLKKRSDEEGQRVDELLTQAQSRTLTQDEVKEIIWILIPFIDLPAFYLDGKQFYFDAYLGLLYEYRDGERLYLQISPDKLSSLIGTGGGANRGSGPFARLAADPSRLKVPLPEFPKVPANVKSKFPELKDEWERWEDSVQDWVRVVQNQLS